MRFSINLECADTGFSKTAGARNITVNALMPGVVETEINRDMLNNPEAKKHAAQTSVFKRLVQVEDIADIAAFFCLFR